jgi:hypothetical protein
VASLTEAQLKEKTKEDRKKSILGRLSLEQAALFKLLSAKDWYDEDPQINRFTRKLVEDKDHYKAVDTIASEMRSWAGQISHSQLSHFLSKGYAARDITKSPGGFTIFMFSPKSARLSRNPEEDRSAIRSMFGDTKLDDDTVKFLAKKDFFLASTYNELLEQLQTTVDFLSLLTRTQGIACEGYSHGLSLLKEHRAVFVELIDKRQIFCTEFAYVLDNVFQDFVNSLGRFHDRSNPIRSARSELKGFQRRSIDVTLSGFQHGTVPNLRLPAALTVASNVAGSSDNPAKGSPKGRLAQDPQQQDWWTKNPTPETDWLIPEGRSYADFFDSTDKNLKANTRNWPLVKHHRTGQRKPLCVRYQSLGKCRVRCDMAHVPPDKLSAAVRSATSKRFVEVYAS